MASAAPFMTSPQKRLVKGFTKRFRGNALSCRGESSEFDALLSGDGSWKLRWSLAGYAAGATFRQQRPDIITVRILDQILHRLRQFRLLAAYPKIPPVKVP
jgi:hypothetical protein